MNYTQKKIITIAFLSLGVFLVPLSLIGVVCMWVWMKWKLWIKILLTAIPAVILFLSLGMFLMAYLFIAKPVQIEGVAMEPNYSEGAYHISNIISDNSYEYERGDVILFREPISRNQIISRIIGLPGETIHIQGGDVIINGTVLDESHYLPTSAVYTSDLADITIPSGSYFVMGDNRQKSRDSREIGFVKREWINGIVSWCYWNCR